MAIIPYSGGGLVPSSALLTTGSASSASLSASARRGLQTLSMHDDDDTPSATASASVSGDGHVEPEAAPLSSPTRLLGPSTAHRFASSATSAPLATSGSNVLLPGAAHAVTSAISGTGGSGSADRGSADTLAAPTGAGTGTGMGSGVGRGMMDDDDEDGAAMGMGMVAARHAQPDDFTRKAAAAAVLAALSPPSAIHGSQPSLQPLSSSSSSGPTLFARPSLVPHATGGEPPFAGTGSAARPAGSGFPAFAAPPRPTGFGAGIGFGGPGGATATGSSAFPSALVPVPSLSTQPPVLPFGGMRGH